MPLSLLQPFIPANSTSPVSSPASSKASSASSSSSPSSSSTSAAPGVDLTNTFLQLLSVQLQNQSPLDPVDPNQFVTQLAQFDSLGELTQIQSLMQTLVNDVGGTTTPPSGASASGATSSNAASAANLK